MEKQDRVNNLLTELGSDVHPADIAEAIHRSRQRSEARRDEGRVIMSNICTCPTCMNEVHEASITMDAETTLKGRVWTTWSNWKKNTFGEKYRDRIVESVEVEGLRIQASEIEAWGINGIYTAGHVILDVAANDPIEFPLDISPFM